MYDLTISVYSHYILLSDFDGRMLEFIYQYIRNNLAKTETVPDGCGGKDYKITQIYAYANKTRSEFRLHRNCLDRFLDYLKFHKYTNISIIEIPLNKGVFVDFKIRSDFKPRDYQEDSLNNYLNLPTPISKLLNFQPGFGKTLTSQASMCHWKCRTLAIFKPMYIKKWINDFKNDLSLTDSDMAVIKGSSQLAEIISQAMNKSLVKKVIIVSNRTFYFYIHHYKTLSDEEFMDMYNCRPQDLMGLLGVGMRLIDETHQEFHNNFIIDLFTHVSCSIDMSATLISDDKFMKTMQHIRFPPSLQSSPLDFQKFVDVIPLFYWISPNTLAKISYIRKRVQFYSHVDFEKSLMKIRTALDKYVKMIDDVVNTQYVVDRKEGQKMLIFAATVAMCTHIQYKLQLLHPSIIVARYVSEDDYSVLDNSDIIVSTLLSSGTAVDIYGLRTVLMTTAVKSIESNVQALGRFRRLPVKWEDVPLKFLYFVCDSIPIHKYYHFNKIRMFKNRCRTFNEVWLQGEL